MRVVSVEGDITGTERKLWRVCGDGGTGGKLTARATKLESDMTRSNFAIGWKFRQSLSCYIANGRRRAVHPSFRMCVVRRQICNISKFVVNPFRQITRAPGFILFSVDYVDRIFICANHTRRCRISFRLFPTILFAASLDFVSHAHECSRNIPGRLRVIYVT